MKEGFVNIQKIDGVKGGEVWDDLSGGLLAARLDTSSGRLDYDYFNAGINFNSNARYPEEPGFLFAMIAVNKLQAYGTLAVRSPVNSIELNKWQMVGVTRTSGGLTTIYINGDEVAQGSSGTVQNGTRNFIIGNTAITSRSFDGLISREKLVHGLYSKEEMSQFYTSQKKYYGK